MKPVLESATNGMAKRRSRWYRAGAMNSQSCHMISGAPITNPAMIATRMYSMKASGASV